MRPVSQLPGSHGTQKTLAQALAGGTLPLKTAMRVATDIAGALREIHEQGRTHGKVTASHVLIGPKSAKLIASRSTWDSGDTWRDTREFGALLFHMLTGAAPQAGDLPDTVRRPPSRKSTAGLRASALQVAADCLNPEGTQPSMQQVVTELRLLSVMLKMPDQAETPEAPLLPPVPPAPFLVEPLNFPLKKRSDAPPVPVPAPKRPTPPPPVEPGASEGGMAPHVAMGPAAFGRPSAKEPAEISRRGGHCPKCDSYPVYVSRPRSQFEQWLTRIQVPICRCHSCYHRFLVVSRFKIAKEMPTGTKRKKRPHRRKQ